MVWNGCKWSQMLISVPKVSNVPYVSNAPNVPNVSNVTKIPDVPNVSNVLNGPNGAKVDVQILLLLEKSQSFPVEHYFF